MSTVTHTFGYAIVRADASTSASYNIIYVFRSLDKAHSGITMFAHSSGFTPVPRSAPDKLRESDGGIPEWWMSYKLYEHGNRPVGSVYIERVKIED